MIILDKDWNEIKEPDLTKGYLIDKIEVMRGTWIGNDKEKKWIIKNPEGKNLKIPFEFLSNKPRKDFEDIFSYQLYNVYTKEELIKKEEQEKEEQQLIKKKEQQKQIIEKLPDTLKDMDNAITTLYEMNLGV